jgi:hypothetical protein
LREPTSKPRRKIRSANRPSPAEITPGASRTKSSTLSTIWSSSMSRVITFTVAGKSASGMSMIEPVVEESAA